MTTTIQLSSRGVAPRSAREHTIYDSPLWDWDSGHVLAGRIVTDPREIAKIRANVAKQTDRRRVRRVVRTRLRTLITRVKPGVA